MRHRHLSCLWAEGAVLIRARGSASRDQTTEQTLRTSQRTAQEMHQHHWPHGLQQQVHPLNSEQSASGTEECQEGKQEVFSDWPWTHFKLRLSAFTRTFLLPTW